jgi:hypothetical protein
MTLTHEQLLEICHEDGILIDPNELRRLAEALQRRGNKGKTAADVIAVYCAAWTERYGSRPDLLSKDRALLKGLAKDLGPARASALVNHYLKMATAWFVQQQHDVTTLIMRHRTVSADMEGRDTMTRTQAIQEEKSAVTRSQLKRISEGSL